MIDLTGGLDAEREYAFPTCPEQEGLADASNMWILDDAGRFALPRVAMEAASPNWQNGRWVSVNLAFGDGRIFGVRAYEEPGPDNPFDEQGRPSIFHAGPIEFRMIEPFKHWTLEFKGEGTEMTSEQQIAGTPSGSGPEISLQFNVDARMAVPPWSPGEFLEDGLAKILTTQEREFMGGKRYEQLFRAKGTIKVGDQEHNFTGTGLRIRRRGLRKYEEFWGHCWQSALFPSGRGFGYIAYPPGSDGKPSYSEGYIFEGDGKLIPARVIQAPWMNKLVPQGDNASIVLQTDKKRIVIEGKTAFSNFELGGLPVKLPALQQAGVLYRWDGEEAYGMMERSTPHELLIP